MNFVVFISLSLIFSTAVLAFPQNSQFDDQSTMLKRETDLDFETDFDKRVGQENSVDHNSPEIEQLAKKLLDKFDSDSGAECKRRVNRVLSAKKQVVAGMKTRMELEICPDVCVNGVITVTECKICETEVWEKPWLDDFFHVLKFECQS